jgi:hypothetical protein
MGAVSRPQLSSSALSPISLLPTISPSSLSPLQRNQSSPPPLNMNAAPMATSAYTLGKKSSSSLSHISKDSNPMLPLLLNPISPDLDKNENSIVENLNSFYPEICKMIGNSLSNKALPEDICQWVLQVPTSSSSPTTIRGSVFSFLKCLHVLFHRWLPIILLEVI